LKLGKKRRESSKRNYYIISPRVIIKAIIIIFLQEFRGAHPQDAYTRSQSRALLLQDVY